MTRAAAVIVTHDSQRWIESTLRSVLAQSRPADEIVVIDDHSTDGTLGIIAETLGESVRCEAALSTAPDRLTRIAQNFEQGVRACSDVDVALLGDHDDVWHPERVAHQVALLERHPTMAMVASDGLLVDADGEQVGGSLRAVFPVAEGFNEMSPADQMRTVLRRSVATGGASAVRPSAFSDVMIPPGWLHDRWWSLVATAREAMLVDDALVIDYRVTQEQEIGLDLGQQGQSTVRRLTGSMAHASGTVAKLRDITRLLSPLATPQTAPELAGRRLLRNLL
ncbi:MAG: glycosyltransferase [Actinobacteria bacterium]|nr:glycosyltransferase [Actinomycetota bacterium]